MGKQQVLEGKCREEAQEAPCHAAEATGQDLAQHPDPTAVSESES